MFPKSKLVVKRQLKQRTIIVECADENYSQYTVTDIYETNMVKEPKFLNFKKYFGYMTMVIASVLGLFFASEKFFIILHTSVSFFGLFLWVLSYVEEQTKFENPNQL